MGEPAARLCARGTCHCEFGHRSSPAIRSEGGRARQRIQSGREAVLYTVLTGLEEEFRHRTDHVSDHADAMHISRGIQCAIRRRVLNRANLEMVRFEHRQ